MIEEPNSDEGADPADDIKAQNPGEKTIGEQAGSGETKAQDLTKAGRDEMDPNEGSD